MQGEISSKIGIAQASKYTASEQESYYRDHFCMWLSSIRCRCDAKFLYITCV